MSLNYESMAESYVQDVVEKCAREDIDLLPRLHELRSAHRTMQSLQSSMRREMGREPYPEASHYTHAIVRRIDAVLLELTPAMARA